MTSKRILQFQEPRPGEPLCSGPEITLLQGMRIDLAHFHTVVTILVSHPRGLLGGASRGTALGCAVTINGKEYERQQFVVSRDDIGKTLFCAGFPCITVTGVEDTDGSIIVTHSEIVSPCEPGTCPWGD